MKETKNVKKDDVFDIFVVAKDLSSVIKRSCARIHGNFAYLHNCSGRRIKLDSQKHKVFTSSDAALDYVSSRTEQIISSALENLYNHQKRIISPIIKLKQNEKFENHRSAS